MRFITALALALIATAGCSELTSQVTGQVKLDGKPLKLGENDRATVLFRPVAGGPITTALVSEDGSYRLATGSTGGIKPGDYLVSMRVVEIVPAEVEGVAPSGRPVTPALYANPLESGLRFTIKSGRNHIDLELDSSAGPVQPIKLEETGESELSEADNPREEDLTSEPDEGQGADSAGDNQGGSEYLTGAAGSGSEETTSDNQPSEERSEE